MECIVDIDSIWKLEEITNQFNRTITLFSLETVSGELSLQFYILKDTVFTKDYTLTVMTALFSLNSNTYDSASILVDYLPVNDIGITSLEIVEFNSVVTLSQVYDCLEENAKEIGNIYQKSNDNAFKQLAKGYHEMRKELKYLSQIIQNELPQYNKEILNTSAMLTDVCTFECFSKTFLACAGPLGELTMACNFGCVIASLACGPAYPICLSACLAVCTGGDIAIMAFCTGKAAAACCL
ncbi:MAG: hypothetical protein LBE76_01240 [Nitrososphaerota archaeon]|jgi:hypothetical protein|nr:hypothetical protein [Nitrososphaerota archaeon]